MYTDIENSDGSRLHPDRTLLFPPHLFLCEFFVCELSKPLNLYTGGVGHCVTSGLLPGLAAKWLFAECIASFDTPVMLS